MSKNPHERIAALQKEQEQLKARAQQLQSQFNAEERKKANRRKYIVGAIVLKEIESNDGFRKFLAKLLATATERDRKLFHDLLTAAEMPTQANSPSPQTK